MPNRQLTQQELETLARPLLAEVRERLRVLSGGDADLLWALRRKAFKELMYDERGKPMQRVALKKAKRDEQNALCALCQRQYNRRPSAHHRSESYCNPQRPRR
jgi:hypothetical protein